MEIYGNRAETEVIQPGKEYIVIHAHHLTGITHLPTTTNPGISATVEIYPKDYTNRSHNGSCRQFLFFEASYFV